MVSNQIDRQHRVALNATRIEARDDGTLFASAEALQGQWRLDEAEALIRSADGDSIDRARAHFMLSILLMQQGRAGEAFAEAAFAESLDPRNRAVRHHGLTLEKLHEPTDPARFLARHRVFGADFSGQEANLQARSSRSTDPDRVLNVAYLTPDAHLAMARFIDCICLHHDPTKFHATLYYAFPCDLGALRASYPRVRHVSLVGMGNQQVAELLIADGIDIAIDLAGHGAGNQLLALQRRPAPIQMTWLDYVATTGVPAIDFRIADAVTDPPGSERWSTELPLRLPVAAWCYTPHPAAPRIRADSVSRNEVLLGSPCIPLKLSDATLATWKQMLVAIPNARLRLLGIPVGKARDRVRSAFAGLDPERIDILGRLSMDDYYRAIDAFDIALDPCPFSGATTTLDCLWQGVPVVTVPGELPHSRSTASILTHAGLADWIARDATDAIAVVSRLASNVEARNEWRLTARTRLSASALLDGRRFMAALEAGLRSAWSDFVEPRATEASAGPVQPHNHAADRYAARGFAALSTRDFSGAMNDLGIALRQLPAWPEARTAYWSAVQALSKPMDPSASDGSLPAIDTVRVIIGDGTQSADAPVLSDKQLATRPLDAQRCSLRNAYLSALESVRSEWLLFFDARCTEWWSLATTALADGMRGFDALSPLGIGSAEPQRLLGARVHWTQGALIGRVWPFPGWVVTAGSLCGNWLLVRATSLRDALDATPASSASPAGHDDVGAWHAALAEALAGTGARMAVSTALLGVDALDDARDAALSRWHHALAAELAPSRARIDVGRLFGVRQADAAQGLIRTLHTHTTA